MGTITSGTGLISGLNTTDIINQLMAIEGKQKDLVQAKVDDATAQKTAYLQLSTRLTALQITSQSVSKPSFFQNADATSSNEDVMTATAAPGAPVGSYQFRVARLVQAEQMVSGSFGNPATALVGAGKLTVELGGGGLTQSNKLDDLRGGLGVSRGQIRVTDRSGKTAVLDLSDAVTLDDVVKKFNTDVDISVKAAIVDGKITLTDASNSTTGNLIVQDLGATTSAADLGLAGTSTIGAVTGAALAFIGRDTRLGSLNDGNGVSDVSGADFQIKAGNGSVYKIDLNGASTVGDVIDQINASTAGTITAAVNADGSGLTLTDSTGGGANFAVTGINGSTTAADLGLTAAASGNTIAGTAVQAGVGTVLLKTLNGGSGVTLGTIHVQNRAGAGADVDLSAAKSVQDVIDAINASGLNVQAAVNASGNGLQLTDATGTGNLVVTDKTGTGSAQLGLAGTFANTVPIVNGANLQRKWASTSTTLASYNGGRGVAAGEFAITAADGTKQIITINPSTDITLGDVIAKINTAFTTNGVQKVTASINAHGDGLALTDNTAGAGALTVEEKGSSTATNLNLVGKAVNGVLDGSMEKTIDVTAADTLTTVQQKINNLNFGVVASVINDGSGANAYRLSLNATNAGAAGQVTFDTGTTGLGVRTLVKAQDAAVFVGSSDGSTQPLLITSNKNQITTAVKGVTLNLTSVSSDPVTISITNDVKNVTDALQTFADTYNEIVQKIGTYTSFREDNDTTDDAVTTDANGNKIDPNEGTTTTTDSDGNTYRRGILLGDFSVSQIQDRLSQMLQTNVPQGGKYSNLQTVGLTFNDDGTIAFDADTFNAAYADDPNAVKALFTTTSAAITNDTQLRYLNGGNGVTTAGDGKNDFKATLKDGTAINVSIGAVSNVGDVLNAINDAGHGKLHAELNSTFNLVISDLTTGTNAFKLEQQNSSQLLANLGVPSEPTNGVFTSRKLVSDDPLASATGGIGVSFQQTINGLINPVDGVITAESHTLDNKITEFQGRISDLNDMLDQKRTRLENQFANLETVLSKLKTQQSSLSSIGSSAAA